jgi:hypothetical protein
LDEQSLKNAIKQSIIGYKNTNLDKFNSTFVLSKVQDAVDSTSTANVGSETIVRLQRRFTPKLNESASYTIKFNVPLHRGTITNKLTSTQFTVFDATGVTRSAVFDETPQSFTGISEIQIINPGTGYTTPPTITINGDGVNATAEAVIVNGQIQTIRITNRGVDYTRATVTISGGEGYGAEAVAVVDGRTGTIRTIYYDTLAQRQIINANAGTIDYNNGVITLDNIRILTVDSDDSLIRLNIEAEKGIIQTTRDTIITIDVDDPTSISTTLEKKTNT